MQKMECDTCVYEKKIINDNCFYLIYLSRILNLKGLHYGKYRHTGSKCFKIVLEG